MTETKDAVVFSLRISPELNEKIQAAATKEKRSRQAQIEIALEKIFETATNRNGKKEKTK